MSKINKLKDIISNSNNIVFFGGAGVSTASNIPDFRSQDGLYSEQYDYPPERIISNSFFMVNPEEFYRFYKNKMVYRDAKPNYAHIALAKLEEQGKVKSIITQNIDNLHQMAGSKNVIELHGSVHRNYCMKCDKFYDLNYILDYEGVPICNCGGTIKPDVVLYEEPLNNEAMTKAIQIINQAEVFIVAGTSLTVYPAANMVRYFPGEHFVLINKEKTSYDRFADLVINDYIEKVFEEIVK